MKLMQNIGLQDHVIWCRDLHDGYHPRNTTDSTDVVECVRTKLDGFGGFYNEDYTDTQIKDFVQEVLANGKVVRNHKNWK